MRTMRHHLLAAASVALTLGFAATAANAAGVFTLQSTTFQDGKVMPKKMANKNASGNAPNCVGENVSPQLSWSNVPEGTKSFVLLMSDPEGRAPSGVSHWVAYGIPASVTGFAEGETSGPSDKYVGGKSTMGVGNYSGPCTPPGVSPHHYTFVLIATDFEPSRTAARPDPRRGDREIRAAAGAREGLGRHGRVVRQSLARVNPAGRPRSTRHRAAHRRRRPAVSRDRP